MRNFLGDRHNFGKFVHFADGRIQKPRSVLWEYLFLSAESPLREFLNALFKKNGLISPFQLAPILDCTFSDPRKGSVEVSAPESTNLQLSSSEFQEIGAMLALAFWFGIGDLHTDNLSVGRNSGKLVCFPIDIECIFDHLSHIKQTLLVPSDRVPENQCGLSKLWPEITAASMRDKASFLISFIRSVDLLNKNTTDIYNALKKVTQTDVDLHPIRIIVRDTKFYKERLFDQNFEGLYESETKQLLRGDIPYFFRFPHESIVRYFDTDSISANVDFEISSLDIPIPLQIREEKFSELKKNKTAILSVDYLAKILGFEAKMEHLGKTQVIYESTKISFEETTLGLTINSLQY